MFQLRQVPHRLSFHVASCSVALAPTLRPGIFSVKPDHPARLDACAVLRKAQPEPRSVELTAQLSASIINPIDDATEVSPKLTCFFFYPNLSFESVFTAFYRILRKARHARTP